MSRSHRQWHLLRRLDPVPWPASVSSSSLGIGRVPDPSGYNRLDWRSVTPSSVVARDVGCSISRCRGRPEAVVRA